MDANFCFKNQLVLNYSQDPGLGIGWAYMLLREICDRYVLLQIDNEDVSSTLHSPSSLSDSTGLT